MKACTYCRANHVRGVSIKHNYLSSERQNPYPYSIVKQMKMEDFKQKQRSYCKYPYLCRDAFIKTFNWQLGSFG